MATSRDAALFQTQEPPELECNVALRREDPDRFESLQGEGHRGAPDDPLTMLVENISTQT